MTVPLNTSPRAIGSLSYESFLSALSARVSETLDLENAGKGLADLLTTVIVAAVTFLLFYLASLGFAGLTLGFAAQDTLSNIISGLVIFWDRPFVIGDLIEVGDEYGRVEKIFVVLTAAGVEVPLETLQLAPLTVVEGPVAA